MSSRKRKGSPVAYPIRFPLTIVHSSMVRYKSVRIMREGFELRGHIPRRCGLGEGSS